MSTNVASLPCDPAANGVIVNVFVDGYGPSALAVPANAPDVELKEIPGGNVVPAASVH